MLIARVSKTRPEACEVRAIGETCGAVYDVFASMPPGARRALDSRTLYRQWKETRLRRDDLAFAIRTLVAADLLRYEWVNGECVFSLARGFAKQPLRVMRAAVPRTTAAESATQSP